MVVSLRNARWLHGQWEAVYRHNGGVGSLARCSLGSLRLKYASTPQLTQPSLVDCITFSVVPQLTALWATYIKKAIDVDARRIIIGDCSGGLHNEKNTKDVWVKPLLNHVHGTKLDWFMQDVCRAKYVIISDDDVFWLNAKPWHWAFDTLESDSSIPIVSLRPRASPTTNLRGKVPQAMGSYCLIIRRDIWLKEQLSFKVVHPAHSKYEWIYDTADFANLELIRRGYKIPIAPSKIQQQLVGFEGVSQGILRIQKHKGDIGLGIAGHQLKQEKTLHAIYVARGLKQVAIEMSGNKDNYDIVNSHYLENAQLYCEQSLPHEQVVAVKRQVDALLAKLCAG